MAEHEHAPNAIEHVSDNPIWDFFETAFDHAIKWEMPGFTLFGHKFQLTKFMVLEVVAAALMAVGWVFAAI